MFGFQRSLILLLIVGVITTPPQTTSVLPLGSIDQEAELTIYTYQSLFEFPEYDFVSAFEEFAGLSSGSVQVVRFADAGSIVTNAVLEKGNPIADVLIGIDNALIHKARAEDILTPYQPKGYENIIKELVLSLAPDYFLTPYDFGTISLWYLNEYFTENDFSEFQLTDLLNPELGEKVIVQNPTLSSPGLGFFLSTIAIFGDSETNVEGVVDGNWKDFWVDLAKNVLIVDSWNDAIDLLYTEESDRQMMVSYTSSPAFGACTANDKTTSALLSREDNALRGWQQIEGLGLVNGATHPDLAKVFIDWFISTEVQSQIYESQWIFPAITGVNPPDCFDSSIDQNTVISLNSQIPQDTLAENLDKWLDDWEIAIVGGGNDKVLSFTNLIFTVFALAIITIIHRQRKR